MKLNPLDSALHESSGRRSRWQWFLAAGGLLLILVVLLLPRKNGGPNNQSGFTNALGQPFHNSSHDIARTRSPQRRSMSQPTPTAEEVVASKVAQFAQNRRDLVQQMARRFNVDVPADVERFFDAVEAGRWEELNALAESLSKSKPDSADLARLWPTILETWGVAEQAHAWPAQKLLDYGNAVLGSIRPDMVYVGGTDPGRFIPALLNETGGGGDHIILTQNALADASYLDYVNFLYRDRIATLTTDDSQRAFQDYIADASQRFQHDQQFPNEPKQLLPGEDVTISDGRVQVSGQVAVMAINGRLLDAILQKNPGASFALEESFPLKSTYADAAPMGPIMELRASGQNDFNAESAAHSVDYWRTTTQELLSDSAALGSPDTLKTYSHMAEAQANLLADHNYNAEAEQAYRFSSQLWPDNPESVSSLSELLARTGRTEEARQLLAEFARDHPDQRSVIEGPVWKAVFTTPPATPPAQ